MFEQLLDPYYISNFLIIMLYPLTRVLRVFNFYYVDSPDELGTTRENSIFYTIMAFVVIKWWKRYSQQQFLSDIFFTIKLSLITSYLLVDVRIAALYIAACLAVWLLFKQPKYNGPTKMQLMSCLQEFEEFVGVHFREMDNGDVIEEIKEKYEKKYEKKNQKQKKKGVTPVQNYRDVDSMVFAEFYVDWAETCGFTKQIWAEYSMKYSTRKLQFIQGIRDFENIRNVVDLQKIPKLAEFYQINTSSMSRQLPTLILFEDGEELMRFPPIDQKSKKIAKVLKYDKKELVKYFDLDKRYLSTRDL